MSGPSTRPPAAAFGTRFEKILEIKNSALLLAFASQEIKEIKRCPTRNGSSCRTWREAILENSPIELKEGQNVRSDSSSQKAWTALASRTANLIFNQAGENQVSAETLAFFQVGKSRYQVKEWRRGVRREGDAPLRISFTGLGHSGMRQRAVP
jgi:hypothetical protein